MGGGLVAYSFFACHSHEFIGDASLSRRSTGPTQKKVTSNGRTSVRFCHISHRNLALFASFLLCIWVCCGHLYPVYLTELNYVPSIDFPRMFFECVSCTFVLYALVSNRFLSEMAYLMSPFQRPCVFRAGRVNVNEGLQQLEAGPSFL